MLECLHPECNREFENKTGRNIHFSNHDDCEEVALNLLSEVDDITYEECTDKIGLSSVFYEKRFGTWNNAKQEAGLEVWDRTGEDNPCWRGGVTSVEYICEQCETKFTGRKDRKNKYCSLECKGEWISENKSGKNSTSWRGGHETYRGPNWQSIRTTVVKRANNTCEHINCSKSKEEIGRGLDVHHIIPYKYFDSHEEANKLSNLIALCPEHHHKEEGRIWSIESIHNS